MFKSTDAPGYYPGLKAVIAVFCVLQGVIALQVVNLIYLNKRQEKKRVANGKPAKLHDRSMDLKYAADNPDESALGENAFLDMTDRENDEFVYAL